jgi:hypothetical protein
MPTPLAAESITPIELSAPKKVVDQVMHKPTGHWCGLLDARFCSSRTRIGDDNVHQDLELSRLALSLAACAATNSWSAVLCSLAYWMRETKLLSV